MRLGRIWRGPDVKNGEEEVSPAGMDELASVLQRHWDDLLRFASAPVSAHLERHQAETHWCGAALALLAIAAEASRGMGYSARRLLAYRTMRWQWQAAAYEVFRLTRKRRNRDPLNVHRHRSNLSLNVGNSERPP